jgi:tRNA(Ile2) C34 agmatinyltransferase TiaS
MSNVLNPLYIKKCSAPEVTKEKNIELSRITNTKAGTCPKCMTEMSTSQLGASMGNQRVYFCQQCRVAEPMPNI